MSTIMEVHAYLLLRKRRRLFREQMRPKWDELQRLVQRDGGSLNDFFRWREQREFTRCA